MEYKFIMTTKTINVVDDFGSRPYGRYPKDGDFNGQVFRSKILAPALKKYDHVVVNLNGYNRYGRSFLDEAFGGLIREDSFNKNTLDSKLEIKHDLVVSITAIANDRILAAEKARLR